MRLSGTAGEIRVKVRTRSGRCAATRMRHRAAHRVADQVHRSATGLLEVVDDDRRVRGRRVVALAHRRPERPCPGRSIASMASRSRSSAARSVQLCAEPPRPCTNSAGSAASSSVGVVRTWMRAPATSTSWPGHACTPSSGGRSTSASSARGRRRARAVSAPGQPTESRPHAVRRSCGPPSSPTGRLAADFFAVVVPLPSWRRPSSPRPSWRAPSWRGLLRRGLLGGGLLRRRLLGRRLPSPQRRPATPCRLAAALLRRVDRRAQRRHQVDDVAGVRLLLLGLDDLAALDLGLDDRLERLAVVVGVLLGLEVAGHALHQRARHLAFLRAQLDVLVEEAEVGRAHLVRPDHRVQHDHAVAHPQRRQLLAVADRHLDHADGLALLQRVAQQHVRLDRALLRLEVVALVVVDRVDLVGRHELHDVDDPRAGQRQVGEVLVGEHDRLAAGQLVALGDVGVRHLLAVGLGDPLVPDARAVLRRTWWKLTLFSSVAEYSLTPMLTRPKETLPFQIDRMPPAFVDPLP